MTLCGIIVRVLRVALYLIWSLLIWKNDWYMFPAAKLTLTDKEDTRDYDEKDAHKRTPKDDELRKKPNLIQTRLIVKTGGVSKDFPLFMKDGKPLSKLPPNTDLNALPPDIKPTLIKLRFFTPEDENFATISIPIYELYLKDRVDEKRETRVTAFTMQQKRSFHKTRYIKMCHTAGTNHILRFYNVIIKNRVVTAVFTYGQLLVDESIESKPGQSKVENESYIAQRNAISATATLEMLCGQGPVDEVHTLPNWWDVLTIILSSLSVVLLFAHLLPFTQVYPGRSDNSTMTLANGTDSTPQPEAAEENPAWRAYVNAAFSSLLLSFPLEYVIYFIVYWTYIKYKYDYQKNIRQTVNAVIFIGSLVLDGVALYLDSLIDDELYDTRHTIATTICIIIWTCESLAFAFLYRKQYLGSTRLKDFSIPIKPITHRLVREQSLLKDPSSSGKERKKSPPKPEESTPPPPQKSEPTEDQTVGLTFRTQPTDDLEGGY